MRRACQFVLLGIVSLLGETGAHAQVSFYTAVDLALRNSTPVRISAADVQHAEAAVMQSIDAYKPSFSVGSSLGYSYGFPVGQPSIYSVAANSLAFSFSQPDYIRSARAALLAAQLQLKDTRQQVILDTALDYVQLVTVNQQMAASDQETSFVQKLVEIETERVGAGLDSKVELTQARLTGAQIALRRLHLVDQADLLRLKLAHLTGLNPADIVSQAQTVPAPPEAANSLEIDGNTGIQAAYASAKSKMYNAFGDDRQNNRPTFVFGLEYNRYAKFNNYNEYYLRFQHNNFNVGVQITLAAVRRHPHGKGERFKCRGGAGKRPGRSTARSDGRAGAAIAKEHRRARSPGAGSGIAKRIIPGPAGCHHHADSPGKRQSGRGGAFTKGRAGGPHSRAQSLCRYAGNPLPAHPGPSFFAPCDGTNRRLGEIDAGAPPLASKCVNVAQQEP